MRAIKSTVFLVLLFTSTAVFAQTDSTSSIGFSIGVIFGGGLLNKFR